MRSSQITQVVEQVADKLGIKVIDLRLSQTDPADLRGFPFVECEKVDKTNSVTFPSTTNA